MTASDTKMLNRKLNRFMTVAVTIFGIAVYLAFDNAGFKREIRAEITGFRNLFEMHIAIQEKEHGDIDKLIKENQKNYRILREKASERKWFKD